MDTGKSSIGLDGNIAAALGYPIGIIAIICLIIEKENRFVKFHALQSILLHVAFVVVAIALSVLGIVVGIAGAAASSAGGGGAIGGLFGMLIGLVWLVFVLLYLGALIYAAVKAYGGNKFVLPGICGMAQKFAGK